MFKTKGIGLVFMVLGAVLRLEQAILILESLIGNTSQMLERCKADQGKETLGFFLATDGNTKIKKRKYSTQH